MKTKDQFVANFFLLVYLVFPALVHCFPCCENFQQGIRIGPQIYSCPEPGSSLSYSFKLETNEVICACSKTQNCSTSQVGSFKFFSKLRNVELDLSKVNDDFCDLGDDEPNTSACAPEGYFLCQDGIPKLISSSRVNDGIVDCCDCSDENEDRRKKCDRKICKQEKLQLERERQEREEIIVQGLIQLKEIAKLSFERFEKLKKQYEESKDHSQLENSKRDLEPLVKEEEEKERQEKAEKRTSALQYFKNYFFAEDSEFSKDSQLFLLLIRRLLQENPKFKESLQSKFSSEIFNKLADPNNPIPLNDSEQKQALQDKEFIIETMFELDQAMKIRDLLKECQANPDQLDELFSKLTSYQHYIRTEAESARSKLRNVDNDLRVQQDKSSRLEKQVSLDFGPNATFIHLLDKEFTLSSGEYVFKFRPFDSCEQGTTSLGKFVSWKSITVYDEIPQEISEGKGIPKPTLLMKFENGLRCYQGTIRSATVYLRCGEIDAIVAVYEPEVCKYIYLFKTPVACLESRVLGDYEETFIRRWWKTALSWIPKIA